MARLTPGRCSRVLSLVAVGAACLACLAYSGGLAFAAPRAPPSSTNSMFSSTSVGNASPEVSATASAQTGSSVASLPGFSALLVAALAARYIQRSTSESKSARRQAVSDIPVPRMDRLKGAQHIGLVEGVQRLFSVRNRKFWDFTFYPRTYFNRVWKTKDIGYAVFLASIHVGALFAPFHFSWQAFKCFLVFYAITGLGITLSYHRNLAHKSFKTPKWLEYVFAYCGALAVQSHPINWVSSHRHHHAGTETENDVHSPLDGFWWSHAGWLLDKEGTSMRADQRNAIDLESQWFYRFMRKTYALHAIVLPIVGLYAYGGLPCVLWGFFFRTVWVWHVTWAVNSVSHVWGFKDWNTPDNSMNNWLVATFTFGEGWHNNHHAFETSCRHGLKWWQFDVTWYLVKLLSFVGLASELKYPSPSKMRRLTFAK